MITKDKIRETLKGLPSKWKDKLTDLLYEIATDGSCMDCNEIKECETLTSLSNFSNSGKVIYITYKDEKGVEVTRSFDIDLVLSSYLDIDPNCLIDSETWSTMTFSEKIQLLIDEHCNCCSPSTTTTTTIP